MPEKRDLTIPIAIIIAGALIGGGLFFAGRMPAPSTGGVNKTVAAPQKNVPPVNDGDHIMGSMSADVIVVEYTDLECPFCKQFHQTMKEVVKTYGGKVAWVVRDFPLEQLHPNAPKLALATECVVALSDNETYWKFVDSIFTEAPINTFFDMSKLTATAEGVGVDGKKFDDCMTSGVYQDLVTGEFNDAIAAGGEGTPFSVVINKKGTQYVLSGSQPLEQTKAIINAALKNK